MVALPPDIQTGRGKLWPPPPPFPTVLKHVHLRHRLFHSHTVDVTPEPHERTVFDGNSDLSLFSIKYTDEDGSNDLVGCLANQVFQKFPKRGSLSTDPGTTAGERVITEAADVIAFAPARDESLPSYQDAATGKPPQRRKFSFPDSFYLDRFLRANHDGAQKVIQDGTVAEEEIRRLAKRKSEFTKLDVSGIRTGLLETDWCHRIRMWCGVFGPLCTITRVWHTLRQTSNDEQSSKILRSS